MRAPRRLRRNPPKPPPGPLAALQGVPLHPPPQPPIAYCHCNGWHACTRACTGVRSWHACALESGSASRVACMHVRNDLGPPVDSCVACREESHSEDATQVHARLPLSGASTPTAAHTAVLQSLDLSLSPSVSQTLDRGVKRVPPPTMPARRKQLRPTRAAE